MRHIWVTKNGEIRPLVSTRLTKAVTRHFFCHTTGKSQGVGMQTSPSNVITLRLRELSQLFNSMDPSPFVERDLDADAEEFITSWARELPANRKLELVVQLAVPATTDRLAGVEDAVRRYFATRTTFKRLEFSQLMRRGRLSLSVGVVFLVSCLLLGQLVAKSGSSSAANILVEGLTICGWVAMWRPLEVYLYDWWPLLEERRRLDLLARIKVRIVMPREWAASNEYNSGEAVRTAA